MKHIKSETIADICRLSAFIIFIIGIVAMCFLLGAKVNDLIHWTTFLWWMAVTGVIMYLDAWWINEHFVDGEWV